MQMGGVLTVCPFPQSVGAPPEVLQHKFGGVLQKFRKGVGGRGGWREEILPVPEIQTSFCALLPMPPLGEGEHNSGGQFSLYFGTRSSPTPSRQPLFKTSEHCNTNWRCIAVLF